MSKNDQPDLPELKRPVRVDLGEQPTSDLFLYRHDYYNCFRLLDERGEYVLTPNGDPHTFLSWDQTLQMAEEVRAFFIVCYKRKSVLRRMASGSKGVAWADAVVFPHSSLRKFCAKPIPAYGIAS